MKLRTLIIVLIIVLLGIMDNRGEVGRLKGNGGRRRLQRRQTKEKLKRLISNKKQLFFYSIIYSI